jgi:hypothetical protein
MSEHQHDDFDALLRAAAQGYNRPGETPREAMWSEIRSRRVGRGPRNAGRPNRAAWFVPAVAAAVLVIGIAIGRIYERWNGLRTAPVTAQVKRDSTPQVAVTPPAAEPSSKMDTIVEPTVPTLNAPRNASHAQPATRNPQPTTRFAPNSANLAYRLAVVQHLAGTEALLTSFRAEAKNGEVDAQVTAWARNLLTTTRLLQASAAQQDPTMKRLLDDLELVLVQIAQYTSAGPHRAEELELIEHSIERRGVIGKLHTTIPARFVPAGS